MVGSFCLFVLKMEEQALSSQYDSIRVWSVLQVFLQAAARSRWSMKDACCNPLCRYKLVAAVCPCTLCSLCARADPCTNRSLRSLTHHTHVAQHCGCTTVLLSVSCSKLVIMCILAYFLASAQNVKSTGIYVNNVYHAHGGCDIYCTVHCCRDSTVIYLLYNRSACLHLIHVDVPACTIFITTDSFRKSWETYLKVHTSEKKKRSFAGLSWDSGGLGRKRSMHDRIAIPGAVFF